jgi:RNA polymerase sigma factor (sigma-70 family)
MTPQDIYRRYGAVVYRRARRMLGDEQAAKDVCQEVFLRLFRSLPEFERASPVTWLYKVTTNHCLNLIRDEQRHRKRIGDQSGCDWRGYGILARDRQCRRGSRWPAALARRRGSPRR